MPAERRSSKRLSAVTEPVLTPIPKNAPTPPPAQVDEEPARATDVSNKRDGSGKTEAAEAAAADGLASLAFSNGGPALPRAPSSNSSLSQVATAPRHNTVRSGPFGPVTSGPARVAAHRGSGTSSPYPQAKESSESDTASRATTEELMEVDEAVEEDVATMGKSAEPHSELASAPALQPYVQSIAEGRKTRRRSNDADTTRKIAESLSPAPKKRDKLSALPERTSSTISSSAPTISVTRKQHMNLYDLSDSSEQDGEAMQSKSTSVTSEASISKSPPQLPKRALAEPDDHAEQPGVASKRAKNGHADGPNVNLEIFQSAACAHPTFAEAPACPKCSDGKPSDCENKGTRAFMPMKGEKRKDDKDEVSHGKPDLRAAVWNSTPQPQRPEFPIHYRSPFTLAHAEEVKTAAAHALAPSIAIETEHARRAGCFEVTLPLEDRTTCDVCLTTIFLGSWICKRCKVDLCLDCGKELEGLHQFGKDDENPQHAARLRRCEGEGSSHGGVDLGKGTEFVPQSKLSKNELRRIQDEMTQWRQDHPQTTPTALDQELLDYAYRPKDGYHSPDDVSHRCIHLGPGIFDDEPPSATDHDVEMAPHPVPRPPPVGDEVAIAKLAAMDRQTLFASLWSRGEPMVVDVDLAKHLNRQWSPSRFVEEYGEQTCTIGSNTGDPSRTGAKVRQYFELVPEAGQSWKIKDYPPGSTFKEQLPALYADFVDAVPFPEITCPHGPRNLAAHAPTNSTPPDLGPKGYWSQTSNDTAEGRGSTDLADAVNIMLWSQNMPDGSPGLAAWDIFRAEDSDKIREFIHRTKAREAGVTDLAAWRQSNDDPIHVQGTFLNSTLRAQLLKEEGVKSFRIWQRPGQVVFIPAGCAHQVCNFSDCIKVASDFVSKENVARCFKVTDEFRGNTRSEQLWRDDVLQLKSQLLWAWRSCERFDWSQARAVMGSSASRVGRR